MERISARRLLRAAILAFALTGALWFFVVRPHFHSEALARFVEANGADRCCRGMRQDPCPEAIRELIRLAKTRGSGGDQARGIYARCPAARELDPQGTLTPHETLCGTFVDATRREQAARTLRDQHQLAGFLDRCSRPLEARKAVFALAEKEWKKTCGKDACLDLFLDGTGYPPRPLAAAHGREIVSALALRPASAPWERERDLLRGALGPDEDFATLVAGVRGGKLEENPAWSRDPLVSRRKPGPLATLLLRGAATPTGKLVAFALGVRNLSPAQEGAALRETPCDVMTRAGSGLRLAERARAEAAAPALARCPDAFVNLAQRPETLALTEPVIQEIVKTGRWTEGAIRSRALAGPDGRPPGAAADSSRTR